MIKKIFYLILLLGAVFTTSAQQYKTLSGGYYADTLKAGKNDFIITPDYSIKTPYTVTAYTASGTDTVTVKTYGRDLDSLKQSQKVMIDLTTGAPVQSIIISTTPKEYYIYDPFIFKLRLTTTGSNITFFTVSRK